MDGDGGYIPEREKEIKNKNEHRHEKNRRDDLDSTPITYRHVLSFIVNIHSNSFIHIDAMPN